MARRRLGVGRQGQGVVVGVVITRGQREGLACRNDGGQGRGVVDGPYRRSVEPAREQHHACQQHADDARQDKGKDARHRSLEETGCGDLPQGATA